jgi:enterochelin esterase-like enzyme
MHRSVPQLGTWLARLAYIHRDGRDLRLDLLRGFAVLAMVVDHIGGQSPLHVLTGGDHFFTSAAEGFVAISGFLVGDVYHRFALKHGLGVALRRLLERAWLLYLLAVCLALVILPAVRLFGLPWPVTNLMDDPRGLLWSVFTLHQTAYLADVALLYALLLGIAPLSFVLLYEERTWLLLGISWGLWLVYQIYPAGAELPWAISDNTVFHLSAWQAVFVSAMVLGYHRGAVRQRLKPSLDDPLLAVAGVGVAALVLVFATQPDARAAVTDSADWWLAKNTLGPGRIAASALVFGFAWMVTSRFWVPIRTGLGWLLLPLGQNALFAYAAHILIVLAVATQAWLLPDSTASNALLQIGAIAILWLAIRFKACWRAPSARGNWLTGPAPLLIAATLLLWASPTQSQAAASNNQPVPPLATNPLGTPIPAEQVAAIQRELSQAVQPSASAPAPVLTPIAKVVATPQPPTPLQPADSKQKSSIDMQLPPPPHTAPPPPPALPVLTGNPTRTVELPGQPWAGSAGPSGAALHGSLRQVQFHSQALDRDMPYLIYLPPTYGLQDKRYPVVYLLHGAGQRIDEWLSYGIVETADRMISSNQISPMLLVMPLGDLGYWVNHVDDRDRWGDYVTADVVRNVDSSFRTESDGKYRAVGGISMGGYGALVLAFNNPQVFQHVAANSPSLHPEGSLGILGTGDEFAQRDPVTLAATAGLNGLGIWLDIGATDPWLPRVAQLDHALNARGIEHNWTLGDGGHDGEYWQRNVAAYLRFYSAGFN